VSVRRELLQVTGELIDDRLRDRGIVRKLDGVFTGA